MRATLTAFLLALLALPAAAADTGHFTLTIAGDAPPGFASGDADATLLRNASGDLQWSLRTNATRLVGNVTVRGWDVQRAAQVLAVVDAFCLDALRAEDVEGALAVARVANVSGTPAEARILLAFPVRNGSAVLNLSRDVTPPAFHVGAVEDLTEGGFFLATTTGEDAFADLVLQRLDRSEEPIHSPTTNPAVLQRFPVIGLHADTPYRAHVDFRDCAGNTARSADFDLRTLPTPARPAPVVTARAPLPGATLPGPVAEVSVNYTGPAVPAADHVSVFVDKAPQQGRVRLEPGRVVVSLAQPLGPGHHTVAFELTSEEGGTADERWSFDVARPAPAPGPAGLALFVLAAAALRSRR